MQRVFMFFLLFFFIVVLLTACGSSEESAVEKSSLTVVDGVECVQSIESKCTTCHYITRVCQALDKKGKRGWNSTVKSMVKKGAKLTKDEQQTVVQCLLHPADDLLRACEQYR